MTQTKIVDKQQSSIQNIQPISRCNNLSELEINRLFIGPKFSKFQLMDIKMQTIFCKHEKAQFFIRKLDSWNERVLQQENLTNIRTQFILMSFIYTSMKRISLIKESQIDKQLQLLYSWFYDKSKGTMIFNKVSMPPNRSKNEYYNVTQSFKTNPALQIDQYQRPMYFLYQKNNQQLGKTYKLPSRQKFNGNFLTELQQNKNKILLRVDKQQQKICQQISKIQRTIRDEEMRRYLQQKQIQQQQQNFKLRKERLVAEQAKNYLGGKFQTALRSTKSSQGIKQNKSIYIIQSMKRMRVQTSLEKKMSLNKIISDNKTKDNNTFQLVEVSNFGLLSNPLETNHKIKKNLKIRGKNKI